MHILKTTAALAALTAGAAIFTCPANAGELYGAVHVGQSQGAINGVDLNDGLAYGAAIGTGVGPFRVELGVDRISGDFANVVQADALDYTATAYLDLPVGHSSSVFGGLGVGYIDGEANAFGSSINASGNEWHWDLGAAHRFGDHLIGEVKFRQINADSLDTDYGSVDLDAQEITVGVRFNL